MQVAQKHTQHTHTHRHTHSTHTHTHAARNASDVKDAWFGQALVPSLFLF